MYSLSLEQIIALITKINNKCEFCKYYRDKYCITSLCDDYDRFTPNKKMIKELIESE